jgi:hypothetical protein
MRCFIPLIAIVLATTALATLDQLFELQPHLMNELLALALIEVHLRIVADEVVPCT